MVQRRIRCTAFPHLITLRTYVAKLPGHIMRPYVAKLPGEITSERLHYAGSPPLIIRISNNT